jgi:glutamate dehydrogenase/leucine dehydrogenase
MSDQNPFETALSQLDRAAAVLIENSSEKKKKLLKQNLAVIRVPQRIVSVTIPVKKDNGELVLFQGYRVQYNNALGPYKGGIRFHPNVSLDEVKALSFWMAMKCSVAGLALGGAKGGVIVDPKTLSQNELERLSRGYARAIADVIGPDIDVPAPDVNTNGVIMGWMVDEYIKVKGALRGSSFDSFRQGPDRSSDHQDLSVRAVTELEKTRRAAPSVDQLRATFTGKLIKDGGSEGREEATGLGGLYVLRAILKKVNSSQFTVNH